MGNTQCTCEAIGDEIGDEIEAEEPCCVICLEDITDVIIPYECNHSYCTECIRIWNKPCPLCRSNFTNTYTNANLNTNTNNDLDRGVGRGGGGEIVTISNESINGFLQIQQKVPDRYQYIYRRQWKKQECVTNNHCLSYLSPYGVLVICEACNVIQSYNRLH